MVDGTTTLVLAIGFLAVSWIIVIGGAAYFNKKYELNFAVLNLPSVFRCTGEQSCLFATCAFCR